MRRSTVQYISQMSLVLLVALVAMAGCGPSVRPLHTRREVPVEGVVTVAGSPLKAGTIRFVEIGPVFTLSGGDITDGSFRFGVLPGTKRVEISVPGPYGRAFAQYAGETSELRAEVVAHGDNRFSFDLSRQ
jgi:hypothetical protein